MELVTEEVRNGHSSLNSSGEFPKPFGKGGGSLK